MQKFSSTASSAADAFARRRRTGPNRSLAPRHRGTLALGFPLGHRGAPARVCPRRRWHVRARDFAARAKSCARRANGAGTPEALTARLADAFGVIFHGESATEVACDLTGLLLVPARGVLGLRRLFLPRPFLGTFNRGPGGTLDFTRLGFASVPLARFHRVLPFHGERHRPNRG